MSQIGEAKENLTKLNSEIEGIELALKTADKTARENEARIPQLVDAHELAEAQAAISKADAIVPNLTRQLAHKRGLRGQVEDQLRTLEQRRKNAAGALEDAEASVAELDAIAPRVKAVIDELRAIQPIAPGRHGTIIREVLLQLTPTVAAHSGAVRARDEARQFLAKLGEE